MLLLSIFSAAILAAYVTICAMHYGVPAMLSDTFYQLQGIDPKTGFSRGNGEQRGALFTILMTFLAITMMICILDTEKGIQPLAFIGTASLAFVGAAPHYLDPTQRTVHKTAATLAAIGCIGWSLSTLVWLPTALVAFAYVVYLFLCRVADWSNDLWAYRTQSHLTHHPWLWAELSAFLITYWTYWEVAL